MNKRREHRVLTQEEQTILEGSGEISILIALHTGMRLGEICGLKWSDVDWDANTISVCWTVTRMQAAEDPIKAVIPRRTIPMSDELRRTLEVLQGNDELYIIGGDRIVCDPHIPERKLKTIADSNCISGIRFHSLRHTFAIRMIEAGVDIKTVSTLMGHSLRNTMFDVYVRSEGPANT